MPCGGIYPVEPSALGPISSMAQEKDKSHRCLHCGLYRNAGGITPTHFCDEWDGYIHPHCVPAFLQGEEGKVVISHGHNVIIQFGNEEL